MKEVLITKVEVLPNAPISKGYTVRGPGFGVPVTYTLADGTAIPANITATRKKDVLPAVERAQAAAAAGAMAASFSDTGEYWGTVTKFMIGAAGLVPSAT